MTGSDISSDCFPPRRPDTGSHHRLIEALAADDKADLRRMRQERCQERKERIKHFLENLSGGDLGSLQEKLRPALDALLKIISNVAGKPKIERENGGILNGGKLSFGFDLKEPTTIQLPGDEKNGFTPSTMRLGKHVQFKLGKDGLTEMSGITVNGKLKVPYLKEKEISVGIGSATLDMKDGQPYLNVEVTDPNDPKKKITVPVPLFPKEKK